MPTSERSLGRATDAAGVQTQVTRKNTDGADHSRNDSDFRGNYPETLHNQSTAQAADAADNTIFGAINDMSMYAGILIDNTVGNVTCEVSLDGTNFIAADHPFIDMGVVARTLVTGTNTNVGPFLMNTPCKGFRFRNEGAVQASVTYSLVGSVQL